MKAPSDKMICGHCKVPIYADWQYGSVMEISPSNGSSDLFGFAKGAQITYMVCPGCLLPIIGIRLSADVTYNYPDNCLDLVNLIGFTIVYPGLNSNLQIDKYVPREFLEDYLEAKEVERSPKACAALLRRLLQLVLRKHFKIEKRNLEQEIGAFIKEQSPPSYLVTSLDAIRTVGNFAAHPIKSENADKIIEVEPGEVDWLFAGIESLFDFAFIQPAILEERKRQINNKLESVGKGPLK
ncbi:MAG: DUF4145 domain-containing protein [Bacteroidetes bacterium]|nr:DUF4145 domain-containing protein [Bacteroidota bacterium]